MVRYMFALFVVVAIVFGVAHSQDFNLIIKLGRIMSKLPNGNCSNQIKEVIQAFNNQEGWAINLLDASAKPQTGILYGNIMQIGNLDECLEVDKKVNEQRIEGKYCSAFFQPHPKYGGVLNKIIDSIMGNSTIGKDSEQLTTQGKLTYGFCVPKSCSGTELQNISMILEEEFQSPLQFTFDDEFCEQQVPFNTSTYIAIGLFALFGALLIMSTLYDYFIFEKRPEAQKTENIFIAFSLLTNSRTLFDTSTRPDIMGCLNGIRVISMMWIILCHGFQNAYLQPHINTIKLLDWMETLSNTFIAAAPIAVDTFFLVSGLLVTFSFLKRRANGISFNLPMFYLHRILRLTPALAMVILLYKGVIMYLGRGPFWALVKQFITNNCEKNWWVTLLYIQNYLHPREQCVGHAWYLAVDTQMYFLSPLILFPLVKWPKHTIRVVVAFIVLNSCYVFDVSFKRGFNTIFANEQSDQYVYLYSPTHVRGTVYLIGMICGYFVYQNKMNKLLKLKKVQALILWILCIAIMIGLILWHQPMLKSNAAKWNYSLFQSLVRVIWAAALCVIILLCLNGYGGVINSILSCQLFNVLIRVNYSMYLLHMVVLIVLNAQVRVPTHFSNIIGFHTFWGDYIFTLLISTLWTLTFEYPVYTLEKLIFKRGK